MDIAARLRSRHVCACADQRDIHSATRQGKFIHSRSHFFTNLSVAGGLILLAVRRARFVSQVLAADACALRLQGMGAGRYTFDHLVSKKRE